MPRVDVEITATDNASAVIQDVNNSFKQSAMSYQGLGRVLNSVNPELDSLVSMMRYGMGAAALYAGKQLLTTITDLEQMGRESIAGKDAVSGLSTAWKELQEAVGKGLYLAWGMQLDATLEANKTSVKSYWDQVGQYLGTTLNPWYAGDPIMGAPERARAKMAEEVTAAAKLKQEWIDAGQGFSQYWNSLSRAAIGTDVYTSATKDATTFTREFLTEMSQVPGALDRVSHQASNAAAMFNSLASTIRGPLMSMVAGGDLDLATAQKWEDVYVQEKLGWENLKQIDLRAGTEGEALLDARWQKWIADMNASNSEIKSAWQSAISSVLQPTFEGNPTNMLDMLGMHIDTADEDARRMAAVMAGGLQNEWVSYFKDKGLLRPEDLVSEQAVQARAATILDEFNRGLRPELINKETAKQRVKEMLIGQQNMKQLSNEIMAELQAEGFSISLADVQAATGDYGAAATSTGQQYGVKVKEGAYDSLSSVSMVAKFSTAANDDLATNGYRVEEVGKNLWALILKGITTGTSGLERSAINDLIMQALLSAFGGVSQQ